MHVFPNPVTINDYYQVFLQKYYHAVISDLRLILIIAYFEFFILQVCKEIIKDLRSENRFSISFSIVFLWLTMSGSARHFFVRSFSIGKIAPPGAAELTQSCGGTMNN